MPKFPRVSQFLRKRPKLAAAFNEAVKNPFRKEKLIVNSIGTVMSTGLCTVFMAVSGAALPAVAGTVIPSAVASFTAWAAMDSVAGAYKGIKAYNKRHNPPEM